MKTIATTLLAACVSAFSTQETEFVMWMSRYNKAYTTLAEFNERYGHWAVIDKFVNEVNEPGSGYTHTARHNKFSDWSPAEFKKMMNGVGEGHELPEPVAAKATGTSNGMNVDWTTGNCVNAVVDQGNCGSCWSFAGTAAVESSFCLHGGDSKLWKLSEQQLVDCSKENSGCDGGLAFNAWDYLTTHG